MMTRSSVHAVVALALLAACTPAPRGGPEPATVSGPHPRGTLFIVGGGHQAPELVRDFVTLAGGPGKARIAVLPMATSDAAQAGREKVEELRTYGADAFVVNVTHAQAMTDSVARLFDGATGVWFIGGDQVLLANAIRDTPTLRAIHARYDAGAVIGGTSAGAAVMSDSMLTGNQFFPGLATAVDSGVNTARIGRHTAEVVPGLGFLHDAIVDQHFIRRSRENRLISVLLERPSFYGVGIDEGTVLRVDPDGTWTVLGASAALVFDARDARITPPSAPRLGATGVRLYLLPAGSHFDPHSGRATLPSQ